MPLMIKTMMTTTTLSPKYPRRGANAKAAIGVIPPLI